MTGHRMITRHWIIESAGEASRVWFAEGEPGSDYSDDIIAAVTRAIDCLEADEAEFVRMYYLQGMTCPQISAIVGCPPRRLVNRHRSALRKLRLRLHRMLAGRYNIPARLQTDCPLCNHPRAVEIDELIRAKHPHNTWRETMRILRRDYEVADIRPQMLITHRKYHMI